MPNIKIMIIDSEPVFVADIQATLKRAGFPMPFVALNRKEAISAAKTIKLDLLLVNFDMPGKIDGFEIVRQIQSLRAMPVIYMKTRSDEAIQERAKTIESFACTNNKYNERELLTLIRAVLRKSKTGSQSSTKKYFKLFHNLREMVFFLDLESKSVPGRILEVNASVCRTLSYANDDLLEKSYFDLMSSDDAVNLKKAMRRALNGEDIIYESSLISSNGAVTPVEMQVVKHSFDGNEEALVIARDITKSRIAAQKIHDSEELYRNALETLARTATHLNDKLDLTAVVRTVCEEAVEAFHVQAAWIDLYDSVKEEMIFIGSVGLPPEFRPHDQPFFRAMYGNKINCADPIIFPDAQFIADDPDLKNNLLINARTIAGAGIWRENQLIGILNIITFGETRQFDNNELMLFKGLAAQAAQAIINAQLYEESTHRLKNLDALRIIDTTITGSLDLRLTPNIALEQVIKQLDADLLLAYDATIEGWSNALDLRDKETEGHTLRVTEMTVNMMRTMGWSDEELIHNRRGALLHDIGKLGVPDNILLKPGPLTEEEWTIMHKHPVYAYELLSPINYLRPALDIPYCHHERWDGSGYPRGLKGEQIPPSARVFTVIDVYDALTSKRPYRKAWSVDKTLKHIQSMSRIHFDPKAVELFMSMAR